MTGKPVVLRERASRDVEEAVDHYLMEGGAAAAFDFIAAVEESLRSIGEHPLSGSPRYADELGLPGLRFRRIPDFPHLIFYAEQESSIAVWRVLHGARDIPAGFAESPRG